MMFAGILSRESADGKENRPNSGIAPNHGIARKVGRFR
jgi:hypothetical protein